MHTNPQDLGRSGKPGRPPRIPDVGPPNRRTSGWGLGAGPPSSRAAWVELNPALRPSCPRGVDRWSLHSRRGACPGSPRRGEGDRAARAPGPGSAAAPSVASRRFDRSPPRERSGPLARPRRTREIGWFASVPPAPRWSSAAESNACGNSRRSRPSGALAGCPATPGTSPTSTTQATGFTDRGFLREGAPADIVVYDLENLKRTPEWNYERAEDFPANEWRLIQRAEGYK